jgi:epoxyqueuosine reductase QueG
MAKKRDALSQRLSDIAKRKGAVVFGIASVDDADALEPVKIELKSINRYTQPLRTAMPKAKSVIVFGTLSSDDVDEIEIERENGDLEYPGYMMLSIIARDLMRALRMEGYEASYPPFPASEKRIARLAGIGSYGKSALIINPKYGPWLRFGLVLTDAELESSAPFEKDLCGRCSRCVAACPAGALKPYVVNANACLVGLTRVKNPSPKVRALLNKHSVELTPQSRVMCRECQQACRYTSAERRRNVISSPRRGKR